MDSFKKRGTSVRENRPGFFISKYSLFFESIEYNRPSIESPDIKFILIFSPNEFSINIFDLLFFLKYFQAFFRKYNIYIFNL